MRAAFGKPGRNIDRQIERFILFDIERLFEFLQNPFFRIAAFKGRRIETERKAAFAESSLIGRDAHLIGHFYLRCVFGRLPCYFAVLEVVENERILVLPLRNA